MENFVKSEKYGYVSWNMNINPLIFLRNNGSESTIFCKIYLEFTVSLKILIWSKSLMLLFGYFEQDNYITEFLARRLVTKLCFELFISFQPNSLIS